MQKHKNVSLLFSQFTSAASKDGEAEDAVVRLDEMEGMLEKTPSLTHAWLVKVRNLGSSCQGSELETVFLMAMD